MRHWPSNEIILRHCLSPPSLSPNKFHWINLSCRCCCPSVPSSHWCPKKIPTCRVWWQLLHHSQKRFSHNDSPLILCILWNGNSNPKDVWKRLSESIRSHHGRHVLISSLFITSHRHFLDWFSCSKQHSHSFNIMWLQIFWLRLYGWHPTSKCLPFYYEYLKTHL